MRDRIAALLDRLPGQCRWDLRMWARGATSRLNPWSSNTKNCRKQRDRIGVCHCGKLRLPEIQAELDRMELEQAIRRHPAGRKRGTR